MSTDRSNIKPQSSEPPARERFGGTTCSLSSIIYVGMAVLLLFSDYSIGECVQFSQHGTGLLSSERCVQKDFGRSDAIHNADVQRWDVAGDSRSIKLCAGDTFGDSQLITPKRDPEFADLLVLVSATGTRPGEISGPRSYDDTEETLHVSQKVKNEKEISFGHLSLWLWLFFAQVIVGLFISTLIFKGGLYLFYKWWDEREWRRIYSTNAHIHR